MSRLLSHFIQSYLLDPKYLPPLLRTLRGALFPNNTLGSPTLFPPSTDQELLALRRKCAAALWSLVPKTVGRVYFGRRADDVDGEDRHNNDGRIQNQQQEADERPTTVAEDQRIISEIDAGIVEVFSDSYCNKHLMYSILELILVRLMPELAERGVTELWEERLN